MTCNYFCAWWISYFDRILWVFGSHFRGFTCLTLWFIVRFLLLRLVSLVLRISTDFDFVNQVMWIERRFEALWIKKIAKEDQRHPSWSNHGQNHSLGRSKRSSKSNKEKPLEQRALRSIRHGAHGMWWSPFHQVILFSHSCSTSKQVFTLG